MSNTRDRILARLRAAQPVSARAPFEPDQSPGPQAANGQPATGQTAEGEAAAAPANPTEPITADDLQQFISLLQTAHAEVICSSNADWPRHLQEALEPRALTHWLCSDSTASGLRWAAHLRQFSQTSVTITHYPSAMEVFKTQLFYDIQAAITEAKGGIAETCSLLLEPSADEPRLMSLVPPLHVALVKRSQIVRRFADLLAQNRWETQIMPSNILLISGPSKTADIQQTLAYGAHGPKELIVVVLLDA